MSKYVGFRLGKMHEKHVISNYYCGGCGWPVTDHDSFCPECGGAFHECDANDLEAENAKLRELVRDVWQSCPVSATDCRICSHYIGEDNDDWCDIPMRMRELGVEVS